MTPAELQSAVDAHPYWYHRIALPGGIVTPGVAPIDAAAYGIPERLDGLRILDVGAWDGYWTFEALRRGAREVVAIDDFSDHKGNLATNSIETFALCRDALGYAEQQCPHLNMSLYDLPTSGLGTFDCVLFFGTLYHCRYPMLALDVLSSVCDGPIYIESAICDDYSVYAGGHGHGYGEGVVAEFYPTTEYGGNDTNWWVPTLRCIAAMVQAAGWKKTCGKKLTDNPERLCHCRGFVIGERE